jgi:hypothetical protein
VRASAPLPLGEGARRAGEGQRATKRQRRAPYRCVAGAESAKRREIGASRTQPQPRIGHFLVHRVHSRSQAPLKSAIPPSSGLAFGSRCGRPEWPITKRNPGHTTGRPAPVRTTGNVGLSAALPRHESVFEERQFEDDIDVCRGSRSRSLTIRS